MITWINVSFRIVVDSVNDEWFVWGAGSQMDNAEMFAFNMSSGVITLLGSVPGYSRPSIAQDDNTVLIPVFKGLSDAVSFKVGRL